MAGLASRLADRGHQVSLLTFQDGDDQYPVADAVQRLRLPQATGSSLPVVGRIQALRRRWRALGQQIVASRPDVVLSFCDRNNVDVLIALSEKGRQRTKVPVVVCERSDPSQQSAGRWRQIARRRLYPKAATVVALTKTAASYLSTFSGNVVVIPSAVDSPLVLSNRDQAGQQRSIVAAGRLEPEKGFDRLIRAFALGLGSNQDWKLIIYGQGSQLETLRDLAKQFSVDKRVNFPGWVSPLAPALAEATIFCLSSRYEGFPSVVMEAMSMGVPTISVDCESGPREIITQGVDGWLVEPTEAALAAGLKHLVADKPLRESLGQQGRKIAERLGWSAMVDQYESMLKTCSHDSA